MLANTNSNSAGIQSVGMTPEMSLARNILIHRTLLVAATVWGVKLMLGCVVFEVLNRLVSHNFCKAKSLASEPSPQISSKSWWISEFSDIQNSDATSGRSPCPGLRLFFVLEWRYSDSKTEVSNCRCGFGGLGPLPPWWWGKIRTPFLDVKCDSIP